MSNMSIDIIEDIKVFALAGKHVLPNNKCTMILQDLKNIIIVGSSLGEKI
jgi:hypothetical protein